MSIYQCCFQVRQFSGDIVYVEAGTNHQVQNLQPCVKAAFDYAEIADLPRIAEVSVELMPRAKHIFELPHDYYGALHRLLDFVSSLDLG